MTLPDIIFTAALFVLVFGSLVAALWMAARQGR